MYVYEGDQIVLILTGIGKIQSSMGATYLFENYSFMQLVNVGVAGSLRGDEVNVGDVFIISKIFQHDMYLPIEGHEYAKNPIEIQSGLAIDRKLDFRLYEGAVCLTGDQFIDDADKTTRLRDYYGADVVEMEAFAIASVAREYDSLDRCVFIKAVSDGANSNALSFLDNLDRAMRNSLEVLSVILVL